MRVANELGAGNGKGAKFATKVAVLTSTILGAVMCVLYMIFHSQIGYLFSSSEPVLDEVNKLSLLLVFTILLNSVQPVLSGVAVGSGWQSYVAYVNLGCYYLISLPLGILMGWVFHQGIMVHPNEFVFQNLISTCSIQLSSNFFPQTIFPLFTNALYSYK